MIRALAGLLILGLAVTQHASAQVDASATQGPSRLAPLLPTLKDAAGRMETLLPGFADRLRALTPDDANAYHLLAEEVAAEAVGDADFRLAIELHALAYELAPAGSASPLALRVSCCLAIADLVTVERDRRWLLAVAARLDPTAVPASSIFTSSMPDSTMISPASA